MAGFVPFTEADVRRLCGPNAFARADILQREGHVLGASIEGATLSASVRGTWRRVDVATVTARAGQLVPACECGVPGFCRHVGALLLQWLRDQSHFAVAAEPESQESAPQRPAVRGSGSGIVGRLQARGRKSSADLARALERDKASHLRLIARERGIRVAGSGTKAALVQQLAEALLQPGGIDAALTGLTPDERRVLDAASLLGRLVPATRPALAEAYQRLGGEASAPIDRLFDLGLLVIDPDASDYQQAYSVPPSVLARLQPSEGLLRPLAGSLPTAAPRPLDIVPLVQVIAQELPAAGLPLDPDPPPSYLSQFVPPGYLLHAEDADVDLIELQTGQRLLRLVPKGSPLAFAESERLARKTGWTAEGVDFVVSVLVSLGILEAGTGLRLRDDLLQEFTRLPAARQLGQLVSGWLQTIGETEIALLLKEGGLLVLTWTPYVYYGSGRELLFGPWIFAVNLLVAALLGRLAPDVWYEADSLAELLWPLVRFSFPQYGLLSSPHAGRSNWVLTERGEAGWKLNLNSTKQAEHLLPILVGVLLAGPLRWLGLVDVPAGQARPQSFRVRPAAAILAGRDVPEQPREASGALVVDDDLTVLVPPGYPDSEVHALLNEAGELAEASPAGLRYRLTAERVQALFDRGVTGPELQHAVSAGADLPPAARARLDQWWSRYSRLRLYDDLTVVELADDLLLRELLAATSLKSKLIYAFSPRLIAIEPGAVDDLVAELTRRGHAPRLAEEA